MSELGAHFEEAAGRSGLNLDDALSLRAQLVAVSGVSEKRAVELLLMAGTHAQCRGDCGRSILS